MQVYQSNQAEQLKESVKKGTLRVLITSSLAYDDFLSRVKSSEIVACQCGVYFYQRDLYCPKCGKALDDFFSTADDRH